MYHFGVCLTFVYHHKPLIMKYIIEIVRISIAYLLFTLFFTIPYALWHFKSHPDLANVNSIYKRKLNKIFKKNRPQTF